MDTVLFVMCITLDVVTPLVYMATFDEDNYQN